ncbi:MAG: ferrous iron transporter B, partial [Solobacterium sp.]|nr:ferrous iron transporter B [Solobacterium sp.]
TLIDKEKLEKELKCKAVNTCSTNGEGLKELVETAISVAESKQEMPYAQGDIDLSNREAVSVADRKRFDYVNEVVKKVETRKVVTAEINKDDRIDEILTNKWLGIPIFAVVMFLVFQISQVWVGAPIADWLTGYLNKFQEWAGMMLENANPLLSALLVDGIIGGVSAVVGFLPLVMVMYFLIALLEDSGYMARVAVILDPIFKKVGLSGKSVIPFVIGIGCAVPGVMASRTIKNERERRATAMLTPFMPCGAKIPVISLFAGAFFENAGWVSALMYFTGIVLIFLCALLINKITGYKARKSFFIIELPEYKLPSLKIAFMSMLDRGKAYIVKAATIILLCNTAVQIMQTFAWNFQIAEAADASILASIARPFAYLLLPITGVLSWQLAAAAITGFIAKENVVGTLAVCFVGLENLIDTEELAMMEGAGTEVAGIIAITKVAALAYLMFNLYTPPCFAAIGAMNSEMKSSKWLWGGIGLQFSVGYTVGYLVYTIGTLITAPELLNMQAALIGGLVLVLIIVIISSMIINTHKKIKEEYKLA